jgi:hypothetical protein
MSAVSRSGHRWLKEHRSERYRQSIDDKEHQLDRWLPENNYSADGSMRQKLIFFTNDQNYRSNLKNFQLIDPYHQCKAWPIVSTDTIGIGLFIIQLKLDLFSLSKKKSEKNIIFWSLTSTFFCHGDENTQPPLYLSEKTLMPTDCRCLCWFPGLSVTLC